MSGTGKKNSDPAEQSIHQPRLIGTDGQEVIITDQLSIGRSPDCSLKIDDTRASRRHALLEVTGQQIVLRDLDSHNGTWVNEKQITTPTELHDGDRLRIGRSAFTFKTAAAPRTELPAQSLAEPETGSQTRLWELTTPMTLVRGSDGAEIGLNREITIGKSDANDLVLSKDSSASHSHAAIKAAGGQVVIHDLGSNNGTWVNGKRITGPTVLKHGDKIRMGNSVFRLRVGDRPLPALDTARPGKLRLAMSAIVILLLGFGLYLLISQVSGNGGKTDVTASLAAAETQQAAKQQAAIDRAQHAVVYLFVPGYNTNIDEAQSISTGSGSLINQQGYILTNFHVVGFVDGAEAMAQNKSKGDLLNRDGWILAGINPDQPSEKPPSVFYLCEFIEGDPNLDLAVLKVTARANGNLFDYVKGLDANTGKLFLEQPLSRLTFADPSNDSNFTFVPIGNSDELKETSLVTLKIIGYPTAGGNTVTTTGGNVSGFVVLPGEEGEWIKTDAEINPGNSGGMAVDQQGQLMGIPTEIRLATSSQGIPQVVGKISYIRPINIALDLIRSACPACLP